MKEEKKIDLIERNEYIREMLKEGLSVEACIKLYENKKKRDRAVKRNETETIPMRIGYNKKIIRECEQKEKEIKAKDWKENNPKQYAIYYIKEVSDMYEKMIAEPDEEKRKELEKKINDFQDENDEWREKNKEIYEETKAQIFDDGRKKDLTKENDDSENKFSMDNDRGKAGGELKEEKADNKKEPFNTKDEEKKPETKASDKKFLATRECDR